MIRAVLYKERLEHLAPVLALWALMAVGFGLATGVAGRSTDIANAPLFALLMVDSWLVPLAAFWLSNGLLAREYRTRSQLFLETLPVSRLLILLVKAAFGALALQIPVLACGAIALVLTLRIQSVTPVFAGIVIVRLLAYVWIWWGIAYFFGLLGRYRFLFGLAALVMATTLPERLGYDGRDLPIVAVIATLPLERERLPWSPVLQALGLGAAGIALGLAMGLVREGSLAALLAERMSYRERVGVAIAILGMLLAMIAVERRSRDPHHLRDAIVLHGQGITLEVAGGPEQEALAARLLVELEEVGRYLGIREFPPIFLSRRVDLEADEFERGELDEELGASIQASLGHPDLVEDDLVAYVIGVAIGEVGRARPFREELRWVLMGFSAWWAAGRPAHDKGDRLVRRALVALPDGPSAATLGAWFTTAESLGSCLPTAVAYSAVAAVHDARGPDATQAWLRATLGAPVGPLSPLLDYVDPVSRRAERTLGISADELVTTWRAALDRARSTRPDLAGHVRPGGVVEVLSPTPETRRVAYRLDTALDTVDGRVRFEYLELPRFDVPINDERHEDLPASRAVGGGQLPGSYPKGTRFAWALSVKDPLLGCRVSSGWRRIELR